MYRHFFLLFALPVILVACNSQSINQTNSNSGFPDWYEKPQSVAPGQYLESTCIDIIDGHIDIAETEANAKSLQKLSEILSSKIHAETQSMQEKKGKDVTSEFNKEAKSSTNTLLSGVKTLRKEVINVNSKPYLCTLVGIPDDIVKREVKVLLNKVVSSDTLH